MASLTIRRSRRLPLLAAAVLLLVLRAVVAAPAVSAHATLVRADPAIGGSFAEGPGAITLWFTEPVEARYSQVEVLRTDGSRLAAGELGGLAGDALALRLPLATPPGEGSYTVVWSTISAVDSHVSEGYFSFTVGTATLPSADAEAELARLAQQRIVPFAVDAAARWLNLLGGTLAGGLLAFLALILLPLGLAPVPARPWRRALAVLGGALALGMLGSAVVQAMNVTRSRSLDALGDPLLTLLTDTRWGALWLARAVLLVALALVAWTLVRRERLPGLRGNGRLTWYAGVLVGALVLLTTSLGSHAAARGGSFSLAVAIDWLHLLATAVWIGGLLGIVLALPWLLGLGDGALPRVLRRFSLPALEAGVVLVVTGILAARAEVVSWEGIVSTRYGMWFALKLVLVAAVAGLGAYHLLVARPELESAAPQARGMRRVFQRSVRAEWAFGIAAIGAAALLTATAPARDILDAVPEVYAATTITPEASLTFRASPGQLGTNEFSLVVAPREGVDFGTVQRVYLRFAPPGAASLAETQRVQLQQAGAGDDLTFRATGAYVTLAGDWTVTAIVRRSGVPDLETSFPVTAGDDGFAPTGVPVAEEPGTARGIVLLGTAWLLAAVLLAVAGLRLRAQRRPLGFGLLGLAAATASLGSLLLVVAGN